MYGTGGISFVLQSEQYVQENSAYLLDPLVARWCSYYTKALKEYNNVTTKEAPKDTWWIWSNPNNHGLGINPQAKGSLLFSASKSKSSGTSGSSSSGKFRIFDFSTQSTQ